MKLLTRPAATPTSVRSHLVGAFLVGVMTLGEQQASGATIVSPATRIAVGVSAYVAESCTVSNDPTRIATHAACSADSPVIIGSTAFVVDDSASLARNASARFVTVTI